MLRAATCFALCLLALAPPASAQKFAPPKTFPPDEETSKAIAEKTRLLKEAIAGLASHKKENLADVEIFARAAEMIVRHGEYYSKDSAAWTLDILARGMKRADAIAKNDDSWKQPAGKSVVRGYLSRVDGTPQPYIVTYPPSYGKDAKKWRLDVVLHGRNSSFTEVAFIRGGSDKTASVDHYVQIDVAGRGNNAYRWAGETDVHEAMEHFILSERQAKRDLIDLRKLVIRGFSMGGAGTWHLGLHYPSKWSVMGPGAGFTTTHGYATFKTPLTPYQEACLKIYDAIDYAPNAANIPIVAYSGEKDAQKLAADNIEAALKKLGLPMTHIIAPDLEHKFPAEWQKKVDVHWTKFAEKGTPEYPEKIDFTTYTLKYP